MKKITVVLTEAEASVILTALGQGLTGDNQDREGFFGGNYKRWNAAESADTKIRNARKGKVCSCGPNERCSKCPKPRPAVSKGRGEEKL